jgi:hypothetical protein
MPYGLMWAIKAKKNGHTETENTGTFWISKAIEIDTRLRVGSAVDKTEEKAAEKLLSKIKKNGNSDEPPALATDGRGGCKNAMNKIWDKRKSQSWKYLQIIKNREYGKVTGIKIKVIYGSEDIVDFLGTNLSYIDRTHLTSRQINGRLVRKTLSFSKKKELLEASCLFEDWVYNLIRHVRTLRFKQNNKWKYISPAMKAGLTDHFWTIEELLKTVVNPINLL